MENANIQLSVNFGVQFAFERIEQLASKSQLLDDSVNRRLTHFSLEPTEALAVYNDSLLTRHHYGLTYTLTRD